MTETLSCWEARFPNCEPVGHLLRTALPDRWVRFHSLPASKRFPEEDAEYATVLNRHNCILGELAGPKHAVVLLSTGYSESMDPVRTDSALEFLDPTATPWRSLPMHVLEPGFGTLSYWHIFASSWKWHPGLFDPIVRLVADDVLANIMIVEASCRWLLHPYDGGMDVIAESAAARDRLRLDYADWLSIRPDGL